VANKIFVNLIEFFLNKSPFDCKNQNGYIIKTKLLKIALACTMMWRAIFILIDSIYYFEQEPCFIKNQILPTESFLILAQLILLVLLFFKTDTYASFILMVSSIFIAEKTETWNLGPMLATPMFGVVWINSRLGKKTPYEIVKIILVSKNVLFFYYALLSFHALIFHLQDKFWLQGMTPGILFTSSYLCEHYNLFRLIEQRFPSYFWAASKGITFFQSIFQLGMIPLLFFNIGKAFVIMWGFIFCVMSLILLQISILPILEVIIWCFLFIPNKYFENNLFKH